MSVGQFEDECEVKKLLAIAASFIASNLFETMTLVCQLFTNEPDGGSALVPVALFMEIYGFLAGLDCDADKRDEVDDQDTDVDVTSELDSRLDHLGNFEIQFT